MSSLTTAGSSMGEEEFHTRLSLEIGVGGETSRRAAPPPETTRKKKATAVRLFGEMISPQDHGGGDQPTTKKRAAEESGADHTASTGGGRDSSKKQRVKTLQEAQPQQPDDDRSPSEGGSSRKKLRLTGAQATMLEDSFRAHNILSHAEKHELARRVGLSARQVEVWFQNRRARTKLKQTEVDCELLRRWCDRLTYENAHLRRDLAELRAAAVSVVCPSCCENKMAMVVAGDVA